MWYKTAKKLMVRGAGYSNELGYLRDTLKGGIDPDDYSHLYHDYLSETDEDAYNNTHTDEAMEAVYGLNPQDRNAFKNWLGGQNLEVGNYEDPIYHSMGWRGFSRPDWNVHFTDNADAIASGGFKYGHPELQGLHLTTYKTDASRKHEPGYNFALPARSSDANAAAREEKYGDEAVIFYGGGADAEHFGDDETQRLFWGKNVDPRMIFPIKHDNEEGGWYVADASGRVLVKGKEYGKVVQWVKTNYRMLQSVREKELAKVRERDKQRELRSRRTSASRLAQFDDANLGSMEVSDQDMGHVMDHFIKGGYGEPQFINSGGTTRLLIHGSPPQNGVVYFYIGANQQFGDNPMGYVPQTQLDDWMQSKGQARGTPVIGCYSGQAAGVNSEFGNSGEINIQVPEDGSGDKLYFGD